MSRVKSESNKKDLIRSKAKSKSNDDSFQRSIGPRTDSANSPSNSSPNTTSTVTPSGATHTPSPSDDNNNNNSSSGSAAGGETRLRERIPLRKYMTGSAKKGRPAVSVDHSKDKSSPQSSQAQVLNMILELEVERYPIFATLL
jgi:hypothetical protein